MRVEVVRVEHLRFGDGSPVRAASAVTPWGDGFIVVQDDATHGAWFAGGIDGDAAVPVRLLPTTEGAEVFSTESGTKHLKPDLEAACEVVVDGGPGVLLLGSGSTDARMRWSLLRPEERRPRSHVVDMTPLYRVVAETLGVEPGSLNMEGAHVVGESLRWYQRGLPEAGVPSASVDLDLAAVLDVALGGSRPDEVPVGSTHFYRVGDVGDVALAITDVVLLPGGTVLISSAAEDSPNAQDDGPIVGSALALLDGPATGALTMLPEVDGVVPKVEGLMLVDADPHGARLLAVADADDPDTPSLALWLDVGF